MPPESVGDPDGLVRVVDADVDVEPRRRVSVLRVLDPVELRLIPRLLRVFELPPLRGRVEARGRDPVAVGGGVIDERRPHRREGVDRVRRIFDQFRLGLDGALEQLVVEPLRDFRRRIAAVDEIVNPRGRAAVGIDDVELLFDAEGLHPGERVPRTEFHYRSVSPARSYND